MLRSMCSWITAVSSATLLNVSRLILLWESSANQHSVRLSCNELVW